VCAFDDAFVDPLQALDNSHVVCEVDMKPVREQIKSSLDRRNSLQLPSQQQSDNP
jgi:hypothetical protein